MKTILNSMGRYTLNRSFGLMLIRVAVGIVFFAHGWGKINNLTGVEGMFTGFGLGGGTGVFIAWLETIGGLALIMGVATRFFGVVFAIEMLVAILINNGISRGYQPHEMELFLMLVSLGVAFAGSGAYSLYPLECRHCGGMVCDVHKGKK